MKIAMTTAT